MAINKVEYGNQTLIDLTNTTASASDVASGKYFDTNAGARTQGTASLVTLLATKSLGTISTSNTQAVDTGQTVSVSNLSNYDLLVVETSVSTQTNNRHVCTVGVIQLYNSSNISSGKAGGSISNNKINWKLSDNTTSSRSGTTAYGIYPNTISISNGVATISMYQRYNSTATGTINGNYTTRVYGINLYALI